MCELGVNLILNDYFTVIDMMVDPDGTLDALSTMGLTSPGTDPKSTPRVSSLHPGSGTTRPEVPAIEPCEPSEQAGAEQDPGSKQSSKS